MIHTPSRLVVLLSGRGSNFRAILDSISESRLHAQIVAVISNNPDAPGIEFAQRSGITTHTSRISDFHSKDDYEQWLIACISSCNPDFVILAGYMRVLGDAVINAFSGKILNIHPSLLPAFKGLNAQRQALEYGVKFSGCTVHFVDHTLDGGKIIDQRVVPVLEDDTESSLSARILVQEHQLYSECIQKLIEK